MKLNFFTFLLTLLTIFSCGETITYINYGDDINIDLTYSEKIEKDFGPTNISGEIIDVCPKKGCWMNVKVDSDTVFVKFKDYGFFVPKTGIGGKKILMSGKIFRDTIPVERLRHYAEDAKKSKEEIELITNPEFKINMIANAVAIIEN